MTEPTLDAETSPDWLRQAVDDQLGGRPTPPPAWLDLDQLPPLRLDGMRLDPRHIHAVVNALRQSTLAAPAPLVEQLKPRLPAADREAFAWAVFQAWLGQRGSKDGWALEAIGHWGGDAAAVQLAALVRAWPTQRRTRDAVLGLEVLRAIGSDTALMELSAVARKVRSPKVAQTAAGLLIAIARDRGLTAAMLDDRIVPTLGLDTSGGRVFDYGSRQFRLVLAGDLRPVLRDGDGKLRTDLPKPTRADDPARSAEAQAEWKLVKQQLRDLLGTQAARLETAMLTGRLWAVRDFRAYLLGHPVMGLLAQRLLWAARDDRRRIVALFRVNEDRDPRTIDDALYPLDAANGVCLAHPLDLDDDARRRWREQFADHEIVQPFAQLARAVYPLEPGEETATALTRFRGVRLPAASLAGTLEKHGWERPSVGGWYGGFGLVGAYVKYFAGPDVTAVIRFAPGILSRGFPQNAPDQTLDDCRFLTGLLDPLTGSTPAELPLGGVDSLARYQALEVLHRLTEKRIGG